jgi:hypothetical protein
MWLEDDVIGALSQAYVCIVLSKGVEFSVVDENLTVDGLCFTDYVINVTELEG